jgi:heme exporter protein A
VLDAASLTIARQGRTLFKELDFALGRGELLRVAGANGSGKTTLLRILAGLLLPDAGQVRWRGNPIGGLREEYTRELVYLGHAPAVKGDLTAEENLAIASTLAGASAAPQAVSDALARYGVAADVPVRKLSQGQRRRAALARLLLSESVPLWLLDEPFAALDAAAVRLTEELIAAHVARGHAVAYTTHQDAAIAAPVLHVVELG